ncbi:MAG: sigma 54-interacting transcriptional regulator, partial [Saprospiraceae bacterium]
TQAYLLRILESGEFIRVGSSKSLRTNVRVIAATNVNLMDRINAGRFREDLYYRLNIVPIQVPSLKQRRDDIYLLFRKFSVDFAEKYSTTPVELDEGAKDVLYHYHWPGNIRELKNFAEQLSVLSEDRMINKESLIQLMPSLSPSQFPLIPGKNADTKIDEREILYKILFDMKKDVHELKNMFFELIRRNDLQMPEMNISVSDPVWHSDDAWLEKSYPANGYRSMPMESGDVLKPIVLERNEPVSLHAKNTIVEEPLSLEHMEKEMISKALVKYKGRRKEASLELGISERTLYRKIRQYDLE